MAKSSNHYKRDGTLYSGGTHKMPNGEIHSGKTHTSGSVRLYHFDDLSKTAQEKAMKYNKPTPKKSPSRKRTPAKPKRKPMKRGY